MPLEQHVADSSPTIQPSVRPPAANVKIPSLDGRIRGARFVSPGGPRAEMEQLADRIAELSARIQAATYELLVLIRQFDQREGWSGFASCAHWLSWRIGLAPGAAREKVRVARALADLPLLSDALRRGRISYSKVRAVTRVATPDTEQTLLDVALAGTAAHVEQVARAWRRVDGTAEAADDRRRHASRVLHTWVDDDGMVVIRGRLAPEVGAVVRRALEAALDEQRRAAATRELGEPDAVDEAAGVAPSFGQRQADALGMVAECALAGGLDGGTAGDRYQVVVHVDTDTLAEDVDVPRGDSRDSRGGYRACAMPPERFRGNVSAGARRSWASRRWRWPADARRPAGPCGQTRPCEQRPVIGSVVARVPGTEPGGCRSNGSPRPGGAGRRRRHPRLGRDRPALGLRRRHRRDAAWSNRAGAGRRPQDAHHLARIAPGACFPRQPVSVPGVSGPPLRCPSHPALGARRGDGARQSGLVVPPPSPGGARGRVPGHLRPKAARRGSCGPTGACCPRPRRRRTGPACRWSQRRNGWRQPG